MKELKSIILTFENCDTMEIDAGYIRGLTISGITETIEQINYDKKDVGTCKSAEEVYFIIKESTRLKYNRFNTFDADIIFNRLVEFKDITHLTLVYSNEQRQTFLVPYEEVGNGNNEYQLTEYVRGFDELIVSIEK
mgnify:CR=1 FL=1